MTTVIGGSYPAVNSDSDATINGLTVGKGGGAVASNTAIGNGALNANTSGLQNVAVGQNAFNANTTGQGGVAIGSGALQSNTTGNNNTAVGINSLLFTTTGQFNSAYGTASLQSNTTGANNTALGYFALLSNTTANDNTAVGYQAGYSNTTGLQNTAIGVFALQSNTTAPNNTAVGYQAGQLVTGERNSIFGSAAGTAITSGVWNTVIGSSGSTGITTGSYNVTIGDQSPIGSIFNITTQNDRGIFGHGAITNAYIKVAWTVTSDARDKTNILPIPHGLDFVKQLNPVSYNFKKSREDDTPHGNKRYGFLAQDILALEGEDNVIIDNEQADHLKYQGEALVPVLVKAIQELKAEFDAYKATHP